jgi:hypothetical protein
LVRRDFYRRIAHDLDELLVKKKDERFRQIAVVDGIKDQYLSWPIEENSNHMADRVGIQETLDRLTVCPVCAQALQMSDDYPMERSCVCGEFTITYVLTNGDVILEFCMLAPDTLESDGDTDRRADESADSPSP